MRRNATSICLVWLLVLSLSSAATAIESPQVVVNDVALQLASPVHSESQRLLVPAAPLIRAMGATLLFQPDGRQAVIVGRTGTVLALTVDSHMFAVDDETRWSDVPPRAVPDGLLLPVRFVAERLGAAVDWQQETRTARVLTTVSSPAMVATAYLQWIDQTVAPYDRSCAALLPAPSNRLSAKAYSDGYTQASQQRICYKTAWQMLVQSTPPEPLAIGHQSLIDYTENMTARSQALGEMFDAMERRETAQANLALDRANRSLDRADAAMAVWNKLRP